MKQLIQSYKTGELGLFEVPTPICHSNGVLVKTKVSLVSAGTEKMIVDIAKKSLLGKAKARPDLVKQVINKMKQEGILTTLEKVFTKLDTPIPLGYSLSGEVVEVGSKVLDFSTSDRVACGGAGYANHSEINYVPKNLTVKIPDSVDDIDASFVTVGSIALQGVRQANPTIGERVAVIGLGLIGQLTVQILKANGCYVIGSDVDELKLNLAKKLGADEVTGAKDLIEASREFSRGYGVDSVIITASTQSNQPIVDSGEICKQRGSVVVVGVVGMDIPRSEYYKKELNLKLSMAYGAGRYDPLYEEGGVDYPYGYVRWTERRNFEAFLNLIAQNRVTPKELLTHQFEFDEAMRAYDLLEGKVDERYLGITLNYKDSVVKESKSIKISDKSIVSSEVNLGLIGAGNFAKSILIPNLNRLSGVNLIHLCTATGVSSHSSGVKYNFKYITTDSDEIFKSDEVNSVIVTSRHNDHYGKVLKAIESKKHLFIEKPLCIRESELEDIRVKYSSKSERIVLQVGFNRRFSPLIKEMKSIVKNSPMSINYRVNAGVIPKDSWIQDRDIGGGRIVGELCHFIDTCSFLTGSLVKSLFATSVKSSDESIPNEDNLSVILNYQNGSTATITYLAFGDKAMEKEYIELFSNSISMKMSNFKELRIYQNSKERKVKSLNQAKGFKEELEAFRDATLGKTKEAIEFESIYNTTKSTFKILDSLRERRVIEF